MKDADINLTSLAITHNNCSLELEKQSNMAHKMYITYMKRKIIKAKRVLKESFGGIRTFEKSVHV